MDKNLSGRSRVISIKGSNKQENTDPEVRVAPASGFFFQNSFFFFYFGTSHYKLYIIYIFIIISDEKKLL